MSVPSWWGRAAVLAAALTCVSCGSRRLELPTGAGAPFADAAAAYEAATAGCRGVRTMQLTLHLSGRAGATRVRGNVDAGFEAPDRIRLEGRHPLGRPVFILAAAGGQTTLLMPRDNRVLRHVEPAAIVEALVGLRLTPGELRAIVSGCGFGVENPSQGREYSGGFVAVDVDATTTYLRRQQGAWRVVAAAKPPLQVFYDQFVAGRPQTVRLQGAAEPATDLTVRLSDVNINVPLDGGVFEVTVPAGTQPLTLDELRRAGPLGVE